MRHVFHSDAGIVQASAYTAADKQHWLDIHKELPPAPGEKKNGVPLRETPQPVSNIFLNIGELQRWVLLRDENLEDKRELLQHDILWHFSPHKACWAKCSGSQSASTTPRSKHSTPSGTPLADGSGAARSRTASFGALPDTSSNGGGAAPVSRFGHATSHKRNLNSSFSTHLTLDTLDTPFDCRTMLPSPSTVQRKKQALQVKREPDAKLF
jgi:hypothetical protein